MASLIDENVHVGMELPSLTKTFAVVDIIRYGVMTEQLALFHIDKDYARASMGQPDVSIHGPHKAAMLSSMLASWCGDTRMVRKIACQYRGVDYCGDMLVARGKVTNTYREGDQLLVECEIWIENQRGEKNTRGTALLQILAPSNPGSTSKS